MIIIFDILLPRFMRFYSCVSYVVFCFVDGDEGVGTQNQKVDGSSEKGGREDAPNKKKVRGRAGRMDGAVVGSVVVLRMD